MQVNILHLELL